MKRFSEQLQKKSQSIKLKASERKELRERVLSYMEYHPLPASMQETKLTKLPAVGAVVTESYRTVQFAWKEFFQYGTVAVCLLLVAVPMLAERTVPGDTLYAVKVQFNEEIRSTLTWDPYQKVEWETTRLNRRLAEARLLSEEGRLTSAMEAEVAAAVKTHSDNAKNEIAEIGETDVEGAAIATIALDSTLSMQAGALTARPATGTTAIAAALNVASQPTVFSTTTLPAYDKLMAQVERNTTRVYELLTHLKTEQTAANEVELADITRRFEDIERAVSEAIALRTEDEFTARTILVNVLQRTQRLTVFMTDIAVRKSFTVEEVVPVVLTKAEQISRINELGNEIDVAVARITAATERIDDESVVAKLLVARADIVALQARATSADYVSNKALLSEALVLAADAISLVEKYVDAEVTTVAPKPVSTTTTPTATSTNAGAPAVPMVATTTVENGTDVETASAPETVI